MSVKLIGGFSTAFFGTATRAIAYLSDGSVLALEADISGLTPGATVFVLRSTDRVTWNVVGSFTLGGTENIYLMSFAVDATDNIHVGYYFLDTSGFTYKTGYRKLTKGVGVWTWTVGSQETPFASFVSTTPDFFLVQAMDLAVSNSGAVFFGRSLVQTVSGTYTRYLQVACRGTGGTWSTSVFSQFKGNMATNDLSVNGGAQAEWMTIARQPNWTAGTETIFIAGRWQGPNAGGGTSTAFLAQVNTATGAFGTVTQLGSDAQGDQRLPDVAQVFPIQSAALGITGWAYVAVSKWTMYVRYATTAGWVGNFISGPVQNEPATTSSGAFAYFSTDLIAFFGRNRGGGFWTTVFNPLGDSTIPGDMFSTVSTAFDVPAPIVNSMSAGAARNYPTRVDVVYQDATSVSVFSNTLPNAPASVTPVTGATVTTDIPLLVTAFNDAGQDSLGAARTPRRAEWQLSKDPSFTSSLKDVQNRFAELTRFGSVSMTLPESSQLAQGDWYIKARVIDVYGSIGPWSGGTKFTVSHEPSASNVLPSPNTYLVFGTGNINFDWNFNDPSPVDFQTAYQLIVESNVDGTLIFDSGKIVSTMTNATVTLPTSAKNVLLRWKVLVYDSDDVSSVFSGYSVFTPADAPVVTITSPTAGSIVTRPDPGIVWTATFAVGGSQKSKRVVFTNTATGKVVYDSGLVYDTTLGFSPPSAILANNGSYTVTVTVTDIHDLSTTTAPLAFTTHWVAPALPAFFVDADSMCDSGYVNVEWSTASIDGTFVEWRVYRREADDTSFTLVYSTSDTGAWLSYHDWMAACDTEYEYLVVQAATRFGTTVESDPPAHGVTACPTTDDYWIIHPTDESKCMRLNTVTAESFTEEYDEVILNLIGRGRKRDRGTRFGYVGSLTSQVFDIDEATARERRLQLEAIRASLDTVYLRNPFGDFFKIAPGTISIDRKAGVGHREFHTATIPYSEIS